MSVLKVLNVGQGDSMILTPPYGCQFDGETLFIDLGPGQVDVTEYLGNTESVRIFITHHDSDHLNGLRYFYDKWKCIKEIIVPFYQNEITLIANCILHLKGIREARDCGEFINLLEEILANQVYIKSLLYKKGTGLQLSFAYEGKRVCDHITCLNPPITIAIFNWLNEASIDELVEIITGVFDSDFARSMEIYIRAKAKGAYYVDSQEILDITLTDYLDDNIDNQSIPDINQLKGSYVIDFIMHNLALFKMFNSDPKRDTLRAIYESFAFCSHDVCTVLRVQYMNKTFLLTGDASTKVFDRLIQKGEDITADYLKLPHHGSKHNITQNILEEIHPEFAIISHNNRSFGSSSDNHPNIEVLSLLSKLGIKIMLTNDVRKHGITCMRKADHLGDELVEIL